MMRQAWRLAIRRLHDLEHLHSTHPITLFFSRNVEEPPSIWNEGSLESISATEIILLTVRIAKASSYIINSAGVKCSENELKYCSNLSSVIKDSYGNICRMVVCPLLPTCARRKLLETLDIVIDMDNIVHRAETVTLVGKLTEMYLVNRHSLGEWFCKNISEASSDYYTEFMRDSKYRRGLNGLLDRETLKMIIVVAIKVFERCLLLTPLRSTTECCYKDEDTLIVNLCHTIASILDCLPDNAVYHSIFYLYSTHDDHLFEVLTLLTRLYINTNKCRVLVTFYYSEWSAALHRLFSPEKGLLEPESLFEQMIIHLNMVDARFLHEMCVDGNQYCLLYLLIFLRSVLSLQISLKERSSAILKNLGDRLKSSKDELTFNIVPLISLIESVLHALQTRSC